MVEMFKHVRKVAATSTFKELTGKVFRASLHLRMLAYHLPQLKKFTLDLQFKPMMKSRVNFKLLTFTFILFLILKCTYFCSRFESERHEHLASVFFL